MIAQSELRQYPTDMPWAIVRLKNQWFAIPTLDMREMLLLPEVAAIPHVPDYVRGVLNLRGKVIPLVDLRKRLGMVSAAEETGNFCSLMAQREQDHRRWLAELEASVRECREFRLTTDPHQCAFGKWYDAYRSDDPWITALLKKFDEPHRKIHGVAAQVEQLVSAGKTGEAAARIADSRDNTLSLMVRLFDDLKSLVREAQRETAVILAVSGRTFGISVDGAVSVEKLVPGSVAPLPRGAGAGCGGVVQRLGQRFRQDQPLLLIETSRVLDRTVEIPT